MPKIGFISDTHNLPSHKWNLLPCDILVHCGDFSFQGTSQEILGFLQDAVRAIKVTGAKHFVLVPGNHELGVQANEGLFKEMCREKGITVLIHEKITLEGIRFFGTPWQPEFANWAYNVWKTEDLDDKYAQIPKGIDVLVTHSPPKDILDFVPGDGGVGSYVIAKHVMRIKPKIHAFGHIHFSRGIKEENGVKFINAAFLNDDYQLRSGNKELFVEELDNGTNI